MVKVNPSLLGIWDSIHFISLDFHDQSVSVYLPQILRSPLLSDPSLLHLLIFRISGNLILSLNITYMLITSRLDFHWYFQAHIPSYFPSSYTWSLGKFHRLLRPHIISVMLPTKHVCSHVFLSPLKGNAIFPVA